ncbi:DeoR/GlpR family DNA-binding transcription regulator [Lactiplantibacillus daowaiensis]|uniref:DeoR/GlpR family DNA-binding transcription regulator n=1 Tax=Lactiplantibacillus daowaiensis TaxID=2559918 RepID=A0ABW1S0X9_9LACO|nr:DeoR/GlpR family DNA-binding transcription regulator [Lactiplantibacillus daowaiensis]
MDVMQRQKYILDQLNQQGTIKIADISKQIDVSRETIRKDVYNLDKQGLVQAIRGGATLPQSVSETKYGKRQHEAVSEKNQIAVNALRLIHDGESIFLDYGTTAFQVAEEIKHSQLHNLTVITNSTFVLNSLQFVSDIQIVLLGGTMRTSEGSLSGPITLSNIHNIYADIGFFGCGGVNLQAGITNHYIEEVEVSKKMMAHCRMKVVLADHTKFEKNALYKTASVDDIDVIITDDQLDQRIAKQIRLTDISLISGK